MRNPWLKKNPFMSMWLSAANAAAGSIRGRATSRAKRQVARATTEATNAFVEAWLGKPPASRRKQRRR